MTKRSQPTLRSEWIRALLLFVSCCSVLSLAAQAQTTTTLVPTSYTTTTGNASSQPVATSIDLLDESGTQNTWSKYVEFNTNVNSVYAGYRSYTLSTSIAPSSITGIQVKVNYQGPATAEQTWTWSIYNWATSSYTTIGTNAGAPSWGAWTVLTFIPGGTLANYVRSSDGRIQVQTVSNNAVDAADIDYEAVVVTSGSGSCTTVPSAPTGLAASGTTSSGTNLSWTAVTAPANCSISSYTVLQNGTSIGTATGTSFAVTGLSASTTYSFTVKATDAAGTSAASSALSVTTSAASSGLSFYVSTTGNDANNGSQSAPWRTIQHAANLALAGDTVYVGAGTYSEVVTFTNSGTATAPIVFNGQGGAIVDGTNVACCSSGDAYASGLFSISNLNYLTIEGFEIRNYTTSSTSNIPAGIDIYGYGDHISILNNKVHNITTTAGKNGNAYAISIHGTSATPISNLTVSGNTVYGNLTGQSETVTFNGNVQTFTVTNNIIHDNNNIGVDFIGFEGTGPSGHDQATNGEVSGNTIYNISGINNPGEGNSYDADGIYCDGCTQVTIERNVVYAADLNIEVASEHSGQVSSYVTVRNNVLYNANSCGISIGGYDSSRGGSDHVTIVNNSLFNNDTKNTGSGEFQVQYYATNNVFKNNIVYAGSQGLLIHNYTNSEANPVAADYNVYYASGSTTTFEWNGTSFSTFASYQSGTKQDAHSVYANPNYLSTTSTPPNLDISSTSPAVNAGINLGSSVVGTQDYAGNPRVNANGQINIGAYEQ